MKILIVDDHKLIVRSTMTYLKTKGFIDVSVLTDSREVFSFVKERSPDIMLLDLSMPHVSGIEILKHFKLLNFQIGIIIISAINKIEVINECKEMGALAYFTKPTNNQEIVNILNEYKNRK